jgi:hypothetical protein
MNIIVHFLERILFHTELYTAIETELNAALSKHEKVPKYSIFH